MVVKMREDSEKKSPRGMLSRHSYAQTNLQLDIQLSDIEYSQEARVQVLRAYELALQLFSGHYRANGKPFIAHLVGTASILASHGGSLEEIIAGLLHAVYLQGEYGDGGTGISGRRRRWIKQFVSTEVEELLTAYTRLPWNDQAIKKIQSEVEDLPPLQRSVVFIRLANDLEDHLDLGLLYTSKSKKVSQSDPEVSHPLVDIAHRVGCQGLALELAHEYTDQRASAVSERLRSDRKSSFTVAPLSHRKKWLVIVLKSMRKLYHYFHKVFVVFNGNR